MPRGAWPALPGPQDRLTEEWTPVLTFGRRVGVLGARGAWEGLFSGREWHKHRPGGLKQPGETPKLCKFITLVLQIQ